VVERKTGRAATGAGAPGADAAPLLKPRTHPMAPLLNKSPWRRSWRGV